MNIDDINPFTRTTFDTGWSGLFFNDEDDDQFWNGTSKSNLFCVKFNKRTPNLIQRIFDFVLYERNHNRHIIVGSNYLFDELEAYSIIDYTKA